MESSINNAAELERLAILSEELGELQQVIGKILRFGIDSSYPRTAAHNRSLFENEMVMYVLLWHNAKQPVTQTEFVF